MRNACARLSLAVRFGPLEQAKRIRFGRYDSSLSVPNPRLDPRVNFVSHSAENSQPLGLRPFYCRWIIEMDCPLGLRARAVGVKLAARALTQEGFCQLAAGGIAGANKQNGGLRDPCIESTFGANGK